MTLAVNQLIGFGAIPSSGVVAATRTYRGSFLDSVNRTTYGAFSSFTVSSDDTYIVVAIGFLSGSTIAVASSGHAIVGNVSGSRTVTRPGVAAHTASVGFLYASLAGDTSVDVDVVLSGEATCCAIAAWSGKLMELSHTSNIDSSNPFNGTNAVVDGGVGFGAAINSNTTPPTTTWSVWSKDADISMEGGEIFTVGSGLGPTASNPGVTFSPSTSGRGNFVVFGPAP